MKKLFISALVLAFTLVSCNQKTKEDKGMMEKDSTMMKHDSTMMQHDSTMMKDKSKMMDEETKLYACPMHPEVQGKLNDKCPKCGMKLTEPVPEKTEQSK